MGYMLRHVGTLFAALSPSAARAYHNRALCYYRPPCSVRADQIDRSEAAMAIGATDKVPDTEDISPPSDVEPPSAGSVQCNIADPLIPSCSEEHIRLVEQLQASEYLHSEHCVVAMQMVDRKDFVLPEIPDDLIYKDIPLLNSPSKQAPGAATTSDGGRGLTVSAPHMHAAAMELLSDQLRAGARILDVGSGSGYLTACFSYATQPGSYVLGVEKFTDVAENSILNLNRHNKNLIASGAIEIQAGNIYDIVGQLPTAEEFLFNGIHVGAAALNIPVDLENLLAPGGRLVIPVGPHNSHRHSTTSGENRDQQVLVVVDRDPENDEEGNQQFYRRHVGGVRFVPLTLPGDDDYA